jgi:hypothetical protein
MKDKKVSVSEFISQLNHPFKSEIETLRWVILGVNPEITEHIKWNGPSFCYNDDDRITFRLHPQKSIQLIFHRGAKVRNDVESFSFDDPSGLIHWITRDRGTVTFKDLNEIHRQSGEFKVLVDCWLKATAD